MDLNYFKDQLFNLINKHDLFDISQIISLDHEHQFLIIMEDGSVFQVQCNKLPMTML